MNADVSPPFMKTSRTTVEEMKDDSLEAGMKMVVICGCMRPFACAMMDSISKSAVVRSPLTMNSAPVFLQKSTVKPVYDATSMAAPASFIGLTMSFMSSTLFSGFIKPFFVWL